MLYQAGHFLIETFPQSIREHWRLIALSACLFFGSFFIMFVSVKLNPALIYSLMDYEQVAEFEMMYHPTNERIGEKRDADSNFMMFGYYIYNNISIGFRTYSSGLLFGLGTLFFILFNGIFIGTVAGYLSQLGYGTIFFSFVSGHSGPELIAIVIAGAAGLKLGQSLIAPKRYSRLQALQQAARDSLPLVYGVIVLLLVAAFIEAFWSSMMNIAPIIKYIVGLSLWLLLLLYFILGGRHRGA
ncbi:stage II sporulation protein M [Thioflexithrix psekupsensis]|uniref:Stage II sporulation protein M n=1 Tax=Thioflexithrix psekupsensis TaxID=1570016 RepID=A0A251XAC5_9GAMM|nr:stage II sporulation protein M [Thioflexithrix psekupsensis]OUD14472.1 hypothetical protein TPSD3_09225 [Thioflexithrix psekupsensis]